MFISESCSVLILLILASQPTFAFNTFPNRISYHVSTSRTSSFSLNVLNEDETSIHSDLGQVQADGPPGVGDNGDNKDNKLMKRTQFIAPDASIPLRQHRSKSKTPIIAILGRPNVGKSALVNRLASSQSGGAIVADESGITRDRTYRYGEFMNKRFQVIDTGGLVFDDRDGLFASQIREQVRLTPQTSRFSQGD